MQWLPFCIHFLLLFTLFLWAKKLQVPNIKMDLNIKYLNTAYFSAKYFKIESLNIST